MLLVKSITKNKDYYRNRGLRRFYDLSPEDYQELHARQQGKCAICDNVKKWLAVDHCHTPGAIRGLLCNPCNSGRINDSIDRLKAAISYLEKHKRNHKNEDQTITSYLAHFLRFGPLQHGRLIYNRLSNSTISS